MTVHARFRGHREDIHFDSLGLGAGAGPMEVLTALSRYLHSHASLLRDCILEVHPDGNMTLRSAALFG